MSKNVSLAIKQAMGNISQLKQNDLAINGPKKPDLFSLSGDTELFQNEKGITIKIDRSKDSFILFLSLVFFGHSSMTITISELRPFCILILSSGLNMNFFPSI